MKKKASGTDGAKILFICEVFESLQGEGRTLGKPMTFIRLGGCNLDCGNWPDAKWKCDTASIWKTSKPITVEALFDQISHIAPSHICFTGGEPLLQLEGIKAFLNYYTNSMDYGKFDSIEFETNGTVMMSVVDVVLIRQSTDRLQINCSPKLSNSGIPVDERLVYAALNQFTTLAELNLIELQFKFVVADADDVEEVELWFDYDSDRWAGLDVDLTSEGVVFMPAAETREELINVQAKLWPILVSKGYNMTTRMHIVAFDKKVGV